MLLSFLLLWAGAALRPRPRDLSFRSVFLQCIFVFVIFCLLIFLLVCLVLFIFLLFICLNIFLVLIFLFMFLFIVVLLFVLFIFVLFQAGFSCSLFFERKKREGCGNKQDAFTQKAALSENPTLGQLAPKQN